MLCVLIGFKFHFQNGFVLAISGFPENPENRISCNEMKRQQQNVKRRKITFQLVAFEIHSSVLLALKR